MSVYKVPLEQNVLEAAQERIMWTLDASHFLVVKIQDLCCT